MAAQYSTVLLYRTGFYTCTPVHNKVCHLVWVAGQLVHYVVQLLHQDSPVLLRQQVLRTKSSLSSSASDDAQYFLMIVLISDYDTVSDNAFECRVL